MNVCYGVILMPLIVGIVLVLVLVGEVLVLVLVLEATVLEASLVYGFVGRTLPLCHHCRSCMKTSVFRHPSTDLDTVGQCLSSDTCHCGYTYMFFKNIFPYAISVSSWTTSVDTSQGLTKRSNTDFAVNCIT